MVGKITHIVEEDFYIVYATREGDAMRGEFVNPEEAYREALRLKDRGYEIGVIRVTKMSRKERVSVEDLEDILDSK